MNEITLIFAFAAYLLGIFSVLLFRWYVKAPSYKSIHQEMDVKITIDNSEAMVKLKETQATLTKIAELQKNILANGERVSEIRPKTL